MSERPKDWSWYATGLCGGLAVLNWIAFRRGWPTSSVRVPLWYFLAVLCGIAWIRPGLVRGLYRVGTTVGHRVNSVISVVVLTFLYIGVMIPVGGLLRITGKDPLDRKGPTPRPKTYWESAKPFTSMERMF